MSIFLLTTCYVFCYQMPVDIIAPCGCVFTVWTLVHTRIFFLRLHTIINVMFSSLYKIFCSLLNAQWSFRIMKIWSISSISMCFSRSLSIWIGKYCGGKVKFSKHSKTLIIVWFQYKFITRTLSFIFQKDDSFCGRNDSFYGRNDSFYGNNDSFYGNSHQKW